MFEKLKTIVGEPYVLQNESMAKHCTFRCGGKADVYIVPGSIQELGQVVQTLNEYSYPYMVIGNGSNILVRDEGYKGAIIEINQRMSNIDVIGEDIVADAGAKLSAVAVTACESDLAGFEFAHGIPGNVGGAVVMNAGAYGGEIKDVIKWAKVLTKEGNIEKIEAKDLELGYRTSIIAKKNMIVLQMCIGLQIGSADMIYEVMQLLMQRRKAKQPLEYPSAGSTFKRPEGYFAGKLIEDAGLRGYQVGGAMVSEKHCGFVINYNNATADDVIRLMKDVQEKVKEKSGVWLEPEVKII
jgi:UDP-N-acetylmuramate dehydrogenase